jgi:hypothetical protein
MSCFARDGGGFDFGRGRANMERRIGRQAHTCCDGPLVKLMQRRRGSRHYNIGNQVSADNFRVRGSGSGSGSSLVGFGPRFGFG